MDGLAEFSFVDRSEKMSSPVCFFLFLDKKIYYSKPTAPRGMVRLALLQEKVPMTLTFFSHYFDLLP